MLQSLSSLLPHLIFSTKNLIEAKRKGIISSSRLARIEDLDRDDVAAKKRLAFFNIDATGQHFAHRSIIEALVNSVAEINRGLILERYAGGQRDEHAESWRASEAQFQCVIARDLQSVARMPSFLGLFAIGIKLDQFAFRGAVDHPQVGRFVDLDFDAGRLGVGDRIAPPVGAQPHVDLAGTRQKAGIWSCFGQIEWPVYIQSEIAPEGDYACKLLLLLARSHKPAGNRKEAIRRYREFLAINDRRSAYQAGGLAGPGFG